ncbi:MAG: hypothetical protein HGA75_00935 [Thiobacillus sp.]|nr:hypothetical protein [Thiobacillus sp.]
MLAYLLQAILEIALQAVFELLAEVGLRSVREPFRRGPINPWLATLGHALFGTVAGGISLLVFPELFVHGAAARWLNLFLTPLCAGLMMALIGARMRSRGKEPLRLESFAYGFVFAFAMAAVRMGFGK